MNPNRLEVATALLMKCSAFDNRKPDPATIAAWAEALDESVTLQDGLAIITSHYANSREWIMPADVNRIHRQIQRQRIETVLTSSAHTIPEGLGDTPRLEIEWGRYLRRAVEQGHSLEEAKVIAWEKIGKPAPQALPEHPRDTASLHTHIKAPRSLLEARTGAR